MAYHIDGDCCIACGACEPECPVTAISENEDGTRIIDEDTCISCGSCEPVCPASCISEG